MLLCAGLPLHGVLHAGGVLVDATLPKQTAGSMRQVRPSGLIQKYLRPLGLFLLIVCLHI